MSKRTLYRLTFLGLIALILASVLTAAAAANIVPVTRLENWSTPITIVDLYPVCAGMNPMPTVIIICDKNNCKGGNADELLLGGPDTKIIDGNGGNDCCIGSPGTSFSNCERHN